MKEHSEIFSFIFHVIFFEVIPYHLITQSNKPHFIRGSTVTSVSRPPYCPGITITLRSTTFRKSPLD